MKYGLDMTLDEINADEDCALAVDRILPGLRQKVMQNPMARTLSLRKIAQYAGGSFPSAALESVDQALQKIGAGKGRTDAEKRKIAQYEEIAEKDRRRAASRGRSVYAYENIRLPFDGQKDKMRTAIEPGKPFCDTKGERIQAHGGCVVREDGVYYWIGENKEHTDGGRTGTIWTWGIRCYRSADLMNWEDLGLIIPPVLDDPDSCLFPDRRVDRPHLFRNEETNRYVVWVKLSGNDACFAVFSSDALTGPYHLEREAYRPFDLEVGDFDIVRDEDTGKRYLFLAAGQQGVVTLELTRDGLGAERCITSSYTGLHAPFAREGIAVFERGGQKFMLTSGMTGYIPNQSDAAAAQRWTDPFQPVGDPFPDDASLSSCNSQFTQVLRLPGAEDEYIALCDRWVPDYPMDREKEMMFRRVIASHYDPAHYSCTGEEQAVFEAAPGLETADTSRADYVWLPIRFVEDGGSVRPVIDWTDRWVPEIKA